MTNELILNGNFRELNDEEIVKVDGGVWPWVIAVGAAVPGGWVVIGAAAVVFVACVGIGYYVNR